jgi:hypothetical protein
MFCRQGAGARVETVDATTTVHAMSMACIKHVFSYLADTYPFRAVLHGSGDERSVPVLYGCSWCAVK